MALPLEAALGHGGQDNTEAIDGNRDESGRTA